MSNNLCKLVQHCINTQQYLTIKIYDCYLLFHRNIIQNSKNCELGLELPPSIIKKIFGSNPLSVIDVTSTCHVDPALYDIIINADKSAVYTRKKESVKKWKTLPYYVNEDLVFLKSCGMSKEDIELFVKKLDEDKKMDKTIDFSDISTELNCQLASRKWKKSVNPSLPWNHVL